MHPLFSALLVLPRLMLPALALPALALPALTLPALTPPALARTALVPSTAPPASGTPAAPHARMTWVHKFELANTTHDGHLTLDQAKAGYASIVRHFQEIDTGRKGFITQDDIRAWHKQRRAARAAAQAPGPDPLRPRPVFQRSLPEYPLMRASFPAIVPLSADPRTVGPDELIEDSVAG
jgi:hypothetical protein